MEKPAPEIAQLLADWEEWERGDEMPGRVLANLKTHGMPDVLRALIDQGWTAPA